MSQIKIDQSMFCKVNFVMFGPRNLHCNVWAKIQYSIEKKWACSTDNSFSVPEAEKGILEYM